MAKSVLIIGDPGTGKSSSLENLNPEETFIINVIDKPLPFRGFKGKYIKSINGATKGNYFATDNAELILNIIDAINSNRQDIKNIIIDDFQYIMSNEFMRRGTEKGFDKFTEIAANAWKIVTKLTKCRWNLRVLVMSHSEIDSKGRVKCKTIGKLLDEKISLEGKFIVILHSMLVERKYVFLTQHDGEYLARSPRGMFEDKYIENDLSQVVSKMDHYYGDDDNFNDSSSIN